MTTLSPKQQRFVDEYAKGKTATEAAKLAGYSQKAPRHSGHKLLKSKAIAAAIAEQRKATSESTGIDAAWVTNELVETYRAARKKNDFNASVRSLGLIGKNI